MSTRVKAESGAALAEAPNATSSAAERVAAEWVAADWFRNRLFQATLLAAFFVYGFALGNFSLHIDVEAAAVYSSVAHTLSLGRWGISLIHTTILREPVVPYFTAALSLLFLTLAALVTQSVFEFRPPQRYVFTILYVSFPQFAYQLEFLNQSDCVAMGLFSASLAFVLLQRALRRSPVPAIGPLLSSGALLVFGASFYDSIVFVVPALCTLWCLHQVLSRPVTLASVLRRYLWSAVLTVSAYVVCGLIARALQHIFKVEPSDYLSHMIGWRAHSFRQTASHVTDFLFKDLSGGDFYGNVLYLAAVAAAAVIIASGLVRRFSAGRFALLAGLALAALLVPFVIVVILGDHQEPRTFVTEQIVFAALIVMAFSALPIRVEAQSLAVAVIVLVSTFHVSRLFFSDTMSWTRDKLIGNRIVQDIYHAYPTFQEQVTPVYFHGAYSGPNIWMGKNYNVFGQSFFVWDGGATMRIIAFFKASGIADFKFPTPQEGAAAEAALKDLPTWPNPNAIRLIDGILIVRMGP